MTTVKNFFASRWGIVSAGGLCWSLCSTFAEVGQSGQHGYLRGLHGEGYCRSPRSSPCRTGPVHPARDHRVCPWGLYRRTPLSGIQTPGRIFTDHSILFRILCNGRCTGFPGMSLEGFAPIGRWRWECDSGTRRPDGRDLGGCSLPQIRVYPGSGHKSDVVFRLGLSDCHGRSSCPASCRSPIRENPRGNSHGSNLLQFKGTRFTTCAHPDFAPGGPWRGIPGPADEALHDGSNQRCYSDQEHLSSEWYSGNRRGRFYHESNLGTV